MTAGIFLQILIDSADTAIRGTFPKALVVANMAKLGISPKRTGEKKGKSNNVTDCFSTHS